MPSYLSPLAATVYLCMHACVLANLINALSPGVPPTHHPPCSTVAVATYQEAPSCVSACDHSFITAHKLRLCVFVGLFRFFFALILASDHAEGTVR